MTDTLAGNSSHRGGAGRIVDFDALVHRTLRSTIGFDPSVADASRIKRLFATTPVAADGRPLELAAGAADSAALDLSGETARSINRAREVIQETFEELEAKGAWDHVTRRLLVALHRLEVADQYRTLLLLDPLKEHAKAVDQLLAEVIDEIEHDLPERAFRLSIARSALGCASGAFGDLLEKRADNCAARVSDVVSALDCIQVAVGAIRLELDLIGSGTDANCLSAEWAHALETEEGSAVAGSDGLTFAQFVEVSERSIPRLVKLLDAVGGDGLDEVGSELASLQSILRADGAGPRDVVLPGGEDAEVLQRLLNDLDRTFTEALEDSAAAKATCAPAAAEPRASRPARPRRSKAAATS